MRTKPSAAARQVRRARLARIPEIARAMLETPPVARATLQLQKFTRALVPMMSEACPGYGPAQHDAFIDLTKYFAGEKALSDTQFEYCLRLMTPDEFVH